MPSLHWLLIRRRVNRGKILLQHFAISLKLVGNSVDSVTRSATRGLGLISKFLDGKSESYAPSSKETAVREETVSLKRYKTVSPTQSVRDNEKEVSDGSSVRPLDPRSETAARQQFIKECFLSPPLANCQLSQSALKQRLAM